MAKSPLDKLPGAIAKGFKGKLRKGTITRATGGGVDDFGDPIPGGTETFSFEGIRSTISAKWVAAGIPVKDASVLVLLASVKPSTKPLQGDKITIDGAAFKVVAMLEMDPAGASAEFQCTEIANQN